jgi:ribosomal protein S18 acetylase RimI-like enzyme
MYVITDVRLLYAGPMSGATQDTIPRSLVHATDIDVLPADRVVERRDGYLVVSSPGNPGHWWGNILLFDEPPSAGDRERWEGLFELEFSRSPRVRHVAFAWDTIDGSLGCAREEFAASGYEIEESVGLVAGVEGLRSHPRENREVNVRPLASDGTDDEGLWEQVLELQAAEGHEGVPHEEHRAFHRRRLDELRLLFRSGRGAWYVALDGTGAEVLGSCGIVVVDDRGRFQQVDTAASHRRRGICSRLLVEAARHSASTYGARRFVIAADLHYHALPLYESLGFDPVERVAGACRAPRGC